MGLLPLNTACICTISVWQSGFGSGTSASGPDRISPGSVPAPGADGTLHGGEIVAGLGGGAVQVRCPEGVLQMKGPGWPGIQTKVHPV